MRYYFAEIKEKSIYALHETTSLDLRFSDSDGVLIGLSEQEYNLLKACQGDIDTGIALLTKIDEKILRKA